MTKEIKLAIAFFASTQMQIEIIDKLRDTKLYDKTNLTRLKKIQQTSERLIKTLYKSLQVEGDLYFQKTVTMVETVIDVVENQDIDLFINLMTEFKNGGLIVVDEEIFKEFNEKRKS